MSESSKYLRQASWNLTLGVLSAGATTAFTIEFIKLLHNANEPTFSVPIVMLGTGYFTYATGGNLRRGIDYAATGFALRSREILQDQQPPTITDFPYRDDTV